MAQTRDIKKRMVAVKNIQRITKTMQMIATARFTAALQRAKATGPYTAKIRQLVGEVSSAAGDASHPLIEGPEQSPNRELLLVISSDRGMCGAYNGNVFKAAMGHLRQIEEQGRDIELHISGKKARQFFKFQKLDVATEHPFGDKPQFEDVEKLADRLIAEFTEGRYDAVRVAYMRFESNARQIPQVMQLMPLKGIGGGGDASTEASQGATYDFSPSAEALLDDLLPRAVKTALFQALNDAVVSEQIMRMIAMKAATDNAGDLSRSLRRQFNRARQAQITTELMEVISGAAALE